MKFQQEQYREFAGQLNTLAEQLRAGSTSPSDVAQLSVSRLEELADDRSSGDLQAWADLAEKIRARGTQSPEEAEKLAEVLHQIADSDDELQARQNALWS